MSKYQGVPWANASNLGSKGYRCGYCGINVASSLGFVAADSIEGRYAEIRLCSHCAKPTFFHGQSRCPDVAPGNEVDHVPDGVYALYQEARNAAAANAYTASVLASRKLLMNIAVSQGAPEKLRFIEYVDFLADGGFIPPNGRGWVDHIRTKGNEATHEIVLMEREGAAELISFSEMLLKFIFEFPARVPIEQ
ncbi:DUF4145 domain-containing protein [Chromatocurvus halotolerans]|uniref:Uncharacterized protein DUF4145 n=1 Tax=Chromatocurvus halotolerans TaxID=1132028 RepID=A0A4V2SB12_9GAMM|nr:DUF4145 domain-containing protein [Chromatocurvus halotolerans]TCO73710.1 uncharacterized protein DUF4145 [Chromatocurvus halotolerans]